LDGVLTLLLLGKLEVSRDDHPVRGFVYNKALALLAYLAATRRPHSREALAGLLWGEMPQENAKANLRKILAVLRDLAGTSLVIDRQTVAFNLQTPYWLDLELFETKLQSVSAPSVVPSALTDRDIRLLSEAVQLYGGDFLDGLYVHDAPAFEEWVLPERERLRLLAIQALYRLAVYHTGRGSYGEGIAYTSRLLALEPWHEEVHQQMMLLLALSGQPSAAIKQYLACKQILADEFDSRPNGDTVALYNRIRSGEIGARPSSEPPVQVLPSDVTPFVGRKEELASLVRDLAQADCRLVTLVGLTGVGKTRMALRTITEVMPRLQHGACFVPLGDVRTGSQIYPAIAEALALRPDPRTDLRSLVLQHLRDRETLLVLDQFEHLLDSALIVAELLQRTAKVKVLVTSLERLNLRSEWTMPLEGLALPPSDVPEDVAGSDAVQLFMESARRARPGFAPSSANLNSVVRICELVGGMPLAIELAAAWARVLTCAEIAGELERDDRFLASSANDVPDRHRSLHLALNRSWNRLSVEERDAFRRLSVFRGGFTREAAQSVAGASLPLLTGIMDKGLVKSTAFGRHSIHPLLQRFGHAKLAESPEVEAETRERHSEYYTNFLGAMMQRFSGPWADDALDQIAAEQENLRAAFQWTSANKPEAFKFEDEKAAA
jgi:predicted ATPase/DNA-binding SARP family transcriptional activator